MAVFTSDQSAVRWTAAAASAAAASDATPNGARMYIPRGIIFHPSNWAQCGKLPFTYAAAAAAAAAIEFTALQSEC